MEIKKGEVFVWSRTFNEEDVSQFAELTGDKGLHHMERNKDGKVMVQGLLTASLGTKIGGDLNYIAKTMDSVYLRPVFSGDTIECELTLTKVKQKDDYKEVEFESVYRNQAGKEVLRGYSKGIIRD
ncbi:hotdog family protein [Halobacillus mangrovi]|uniref:Enoyl-CoA hydratase n=1 Tax=Halobacillus mangrovi TaxID=402384 RepID=A0A1W5ZX64_9BACI|nr:MaoC/PaaZ C-terminal domain-containing protein [Halobacillus mangrovi]ARI77869.1 enoyl-CoA hydratase [Halobacillus mangrovi]